VIVRRPTLPASGSCPVRLPSGRVGVRRGRPSGRPEVSSLFLSGRTVGCTCARCSASSAVTSRRELGRALAPSGDSTLIEVGSLRHTGSCCPSRGWPMLPCAEVRVRGGGGDVVQPLPFGEGGRMRILLLCSVFNGLTQGAGVQLREARRHRSLGRRRRRRGCGHAGRSGSRDRSVPSGAGSAQVGRRPERLGLGPVVLPHAPVARAATLVAGR